MTPKTLMKLFTAITMNPEGLYRFASFQMLTCLVLPKLLLFLFKSPREVINNEKKEILRHAKTYFFFDKKVAI